MPRTFDALLIIVTYHFEMEVSVNLRLNKQSLDQDDDSVTDRRAHDERNGLLKLPI